MISASQNIKLLDFGLAKFSEAANVTEFTATQTMCTREGQILGTVFYMSPEQAEGRVVDARSDIFSFGSVLYEMITGRRPFDGESNLATLAAILHEQPKPANELNPAVSRELGQLIDKCMEKKPGRRFASMKALKAALEMQLAAESGMLIPARLGRWRRPAKLTLALLLGLGAMWWGSSHVKPAAIYLFCFVIGFGFSVVAALSGAFICTSTHPSMPLPGCMPETYPTEPPLYRASMPARLRPSSPGLAAPVMCWRGISGWASSLPTSAAVALGFGGAFVVFLFVAKVLLRHDREFNPADYDLLAL